MRRWELIILFRCSEPWQAAVREGGWEEEGGGKGGEEGHRGTHQKHQRARPDWGDQPFLLLPSRALGQLSNQVTSLSRVASGQLFSSLSPFSLSLPPLLSVPQPAAVAADVIFDRILSVPACWLLPPCLNKCKHGEGSFKQVHAANMRIFHVGQTEGRRSNCNAALMQTGHDMQTQIRSFNFFQVSLWKDIPLTMQQQRNTPGNTATLKIWELHSC